MSPSSSAPPSARATATVTTTPTSHECRGEREQDGDDKTKSAVRSRAKSTTINNSASSSNNNNNNNKACPTTSTLALEEAEHFVDYLPHPLLRRGGDCRPPPACKDASSDQAENIESAVGDKTVMTTSSNNKIVLIEYLHEHAMLKSFLAGSFSASCSTLLFQPFDLLKTRIQSAHLLTNTAVSSSSSSSSSQATAAATSRMLPLIFDVVKNEQLFGLWRGTGPSLLRTVPGVGLHFCCLDRLQSHFCAGRRQPSAMEALTFGMASRTIAGVLLIPVTVVKTRYESRVFAYRSLTEAIRDIYRHEGARGLTSGLMATLMRDVPFSGIYFMFYTQLKTLLLEADERRASKSKLSTSIVTFACGLQAGLLASVVTQPMDVVKTHMQLNRLPNASLSSTVIRIVRQQGAAGLFAGMLPRLLRRTLMASMAWTVYEQMMKGIGLK